MLVKFKELTTEQQLEINNYYLDFCQTKGITKSLDDFLIDHEIMFNPKTLEMLTTESTDFWQLA